MCLVGEKRDKEDKMTEVSHQLHIGIDYFYSHQSILLFLDPLSNKQIKGSALGEMLGSISPVSMFKIILNHAGVDVASQLIRFDQLSTGSKLSSIQ